MAKLTVLNITLVQVIIVFCTFLLLMTTVVSSTISDFKVNALDGQLIDFAQYAGKTLLIVNTASECGYTPQYADLQKLHETFGNKVTILGFPANNFLGQEPGSNMQIAAFCQKNYGVTFQMFDVSWGRIIVAPAATLRIAFARTSSDTSLSSQPLAPARTMSRSTSSSSKVVNTIADGTR